MANTVLPEGVEDITYPSIVFKIRGGYYAVNSRYITTILQLPHFDPLPDAPPYITGIFSYRGSVIQMLDLRSLFGMPTLNDEFLTFTEMIQARKQDHIRWVNELDRVMGAGDPFTLATDPHQCAFGKWYDSFECENNEVNFVLRKIEGPHRRLHEAALEAIACNHKCDECQRSICLKDVLSKARHNYMPTILHLLDETLDVFKSAIYHEMVLVLSSEHNIGIVVDEVLAVEELSPAGQGSELEGFSRSPYIAGIERSERIPNLILELNVPVLQDLAIIA